MKWLTFLLGIAVLETLFQVLTSSRLEKALTKIVTVVPQSEYPQKITQKRAKRFHKFARDTYQLNSESNKVNPNPDNVPSQ